MPGAAALLRNPGFWVENRLVAGIVRLARRYDACHALMHIPHCLCRVLAALLLSWLRHALDAAR